MVDTPKRTTPLETTREEAEQHLAEVLKEIREGQKAFGAHDESTWKKIEKDLDAVNGEFDQLIEGLPQQHPILNTQALDGVGEEKLATILPFLNPEAQEKIQQVLRKRMELRQRLEQQRQQMMSPRAGG